MSAFYGYAWSASAYRLLDAAFDEFERLIGCDDAEAPCAVACAPAAAAGAVRHTARFALAARLASTARLNRPTPMPTTTPKTGAQHKRGTPRASQGWVLARLPRTSGSCRASATIVPFPAVSTVTADMERAA